MTVGMGVEFSRKVHLKFQGEGEVWGRDVGVWDGGWGGVGG